MIVAQLWLLFFLYTAYAQIIIPAEKLTEIIEVWTEEGVFKILVYS